MDKAGLNIFYASQLVVADIRLRFNNRMAAAVLEHKPIVGTVVVTISVNNTKIPLTFGNTGDCVIGQSPNYPIDMALYDCDSGLMVIVFLRPLPQGTTVSVEYEYDRS